MDLRKALEKEHSKELTTKIVNDIIAHPKKMDDLVKVFIDGPMRITQRASWPLSF